jgi:hypothetical protein
VKSACVLRPIVMFRNINGSRKLSGWGTIMISAIRLCLRCGGRLPDDRAHRCLGGR